MARLDANGSSINSRCGFRDVHALREFLRTDPHTIPPSVLMSKLETILTAIGYRSIRASWTQKPHHAGEIAGRWRTARRIDRSMAHRVCAIGDSYPERGSEEIADASPETTPCSFEECAGYQREEISDTSEGESLAPARLPAHKFHRYKDLPAGAPRELTWPGAAWDAGIPIRSKTSGTLPLAFAAALKILRDTLPGEAWVRDPGELARTVGSMLIACFHRGDFHTFAESAAGVQHFLSEQAHQDDTVEIPSAIHPREALIKAFEWMNAGMDPAYREDVARVANARMQEVRTDVAYVAHPILHPQ
jgi:hypothetical protein